MTGPAPHDQRGRRVMLLGSPGLGWPDRRELARRIAADESPDVLGLHLGAMPVDEEYLDRYPGLAGRVLRLFPLALAQGLVALRRGRDYDLVLSWSEPATYVLATLQLLSRRRLRHVSVHSWISKPKKAVPLKLLHRSIERLIIPPSQQHAFAVHRLRLPAAKMPRVNWSVDLAFWRPVDLPTDMICCVGREMRDYVTLIEALRPLPLRCHIAAGALRAAHNPWLARIDTELPETITLGRLDAPALRELYARSRFTVVPLLPSRTDNGITAILESFAMGKPVIVTQTPGQVDVVQHGVNGLVVPPASPEALRAAVQRLWDAPEECLHMGRNARQWVEKHHSLQQWVTAFDDDRP